jgi:hypothetical protein
VHDGVFALEVSISDGFFHSIVDRVISGSSHIGAAANPVSETNEEKVASQKAKTAKQAARNKKHEDTAARGQEAARTG